MLLSHGVDSDLTWKVHSCLTNEDSRCYRANGQSDTCREDVNTRKNRCAVENSLEVEWEVVRSSNEDVAVEEADK